MNKYEEMKAKLIEILREKEYEVERLDLSDGALTLAFKQLSDLQAQAVSLRLSTGYSVNDIARSLGCTPATVYNSVTRLIKSIPVMEDVITDKSPLTEVKGLSGDTRNALMRGGIKTVGDFLKYVDSGDVDDLRIRSIGTRAKIECKKVRSALAI